MKLQLPVSATLDHWDARSPQSLPPWITGMCVAAPALPAGEMPSPRGSCTAICTRWWADAGLCTVWGWTSHRVMLQREGFVQLLLAASVSALPWVLEVHWYGRNTVPHPGSSWDSPPTPQHPSSAADPLPFSPQETGDTSELCANQPTASCRVRCEWACQKALEQWWQGSGWQAGRAPPVPLIW